MSKLIALNGTVGRGLYAIVDDSDFEIASRYRWIALKRVDCFYVGASMRKNGQAKFVLMHRFLTDCPQGWVVDHYNGDGLDNRRENLRVCTVAQNMANQRLSRANKSGYKGVSWNKEKRKWVAKIKANGEQKQLGRFHTKEEAATAYNHAAISLFGEYARLNPL